MYAVIRKELGMIASRPDLGRRLPTALRLREGSTQSAQEKLLSRCGAKNGFATLYRQRKTLSHRHLPRLEFSPAHRQLDRVKTPTARRLAPLNTPPPEGTLVRQRKRDFRSLTLVSPLVQGFSR